MRIKIGNNGRLGNKMFQYMFCRRLQDLVPLSSVDGFKIPEFNLTSPDRPLEGRVLHIRDGHRHSMNSIAHMLNERIYDHVLFDGYVQRLEYYPNRDLLSGLFPSPHETDLTHLGAGNLLINVRGAEVLAATHADYGPVPVDFFSQVATETKLTPVIMGQMGDDAYSDEIRIRFRGCVFLPSHSAIRDFEIVRHAKNITFGVSSFSWLAAWLSKTAEAIHMPVSGYYNPLQRSDIDLLPVGDDRYRFYDFPVQKWAATEEQQAYVLGSGKTFRRLTPHEIRARIVYH